MNLEFDPERQQKAKEYARKRYLLFALDLAQGALILALFLFGGLSTWLKEVLESFAPRREVLIALYFLAFYAFYWLAGLPLAWYGGFVLQHRYGLSTQSLKSWFSDQLKASALAVVLGVIATELLYLLLAKSPDLWWLWAWVAFTFFSVILTNLFPVLILPLFIPFRPLEDEDLKSRLMRLAERAGTKVRGIFTLELSAKTTAGNAALVGWGNTRRILLGDTLLKDYSPDEIETILAHELAHHIHRDIAWGIAFQSFLNLFIFWATGQIFPTLVRLMGYEGVEDLAAFPLLAGTMGVLLFLSTPITAAYSRWRESLADDYSLKATQNPEAFASAMVKLADQNLAEAFPPRWAEILFYSHPPIGKRVLKAKKWTKEENCASR
ncbi:MAG: M48 family metallopeptidase [Anaerolineae bacterium]|nr:M48 family metallopeptidase [Anaerolineae bacterium]